MHDSMPSWIERTATGIRLPLGGSMGLLVVDIDERTKVHVKDNVFAPDGWHLWLSLWQGHRCISTGVEVVQDLDDGTLECAARTFAEAQL